MSTLRQVPKWCCDIILVMSFNTLLSFLLKFITAGQKQETGLKILKLYWKATCPKLLSFAQLPHLFFLLGNFSRVNECVQVSVGLSAGTHGERQPLSFWGAPAGFTRELAAWMLLQEVQTAQSPGYCLFKQQLLLAAQAALHNWIRFPF